MIKKSIKIALTVSILVSTAFADNEDWSLMSRNGVCVDTKILKNKFNGIGEVTSPDQFIQKLNKMKIEAIVTDYTENSVGIKVPSKELSLVFVRKPLCNKLVNN